MKRPRALAVLSLVGLFLATVPAAQAICSVFFPLGCLKKQVKYGDEFEAQIIDIRSTLTEYESVGQPGPGWSSLQNTRDYYVWYKYGATVYGAGIQYTVVQIPFSYKPKREEWIGKMIKMHLEDQKRMGIKGTVVKMKRPDGKEWELALVSIVGPDGKDECKRAMDIPYCRPQTKIDRAAREEEQLSAIQKASGKSATDIAPAPVNVESAPGAAAPVDAAAPPTAPAAPAESAAAPPTPAAPAAAASPPAAEQPPAAPPLPK